MKWLYRLESKTPDNGLWYNSNNELVWGIGKIKDCQTKFLPMDYDERYHKDNKNWFSSCSNKEDLLHWYSLKDAEELIKNGFIFTKYLAKDYIEYPLETTFLKETCLDRKEIDIKNLFNNTLSKQQIQYFTQYFSKQEERKYPCSNQTVICGIFSNKTQEEINKIMIQRDCIYNFRQKVWYSKKDKQEKWVLFKDNYKKCRGFRFYKIIIDKDIDKNAFEDIILPVCSLYCCEMTFI